MLLETFVKNHYVLEIFACIIYPNLMFFLFDIFFQVSFEDEDNEESRKEIYSILDMESVRIFNDDCCICLENFNKNTKQVITNFCKHKYHQKCLDCWLQKSKLCPLCRHKF